MTEMAETEIFEMNEDIDLESSYEILQENETWREIWHDTLETEYVTCGEKVILTCDHHEEE